MFSIGSQNLNVKNLVLLNAYKHVRNMIHWHLKCQFWQKITKNRPAAGGLAPRST